MFRVVEVSERAPEDPEWMGTKQKFWFQHPELGRSLFKLARPGTGEDWSEKLAAEICALLGLPHATYELATWMGQRGTVSPSFVAPGEALVHGNELLVASIEDYPAPGEEDRFHNSRHTIDAVLGTLDRSGASRTRGWDSLPGIETAADLFVGYILLDVLVGNTDRHHENWGIVESPADRGSAHASRSLAPTYDHASSLGRNESAETVKRRLETRDRGFGVEAYAARAPSAFYGSASDSRPLSTIEAFRSISRRRPDAARIWLEHFASVPHDALGALCDRVPEERMSPLAVEFVRRILRYNRDRLLALEDGGP
jgi:hypothetical protein